MPQPPWKDALARARRGDGGRPRPGDRMAPATIAPARPASPRDAKQLVAQAPGLQELLAERQALEARMHGLTGQGSADPRYVVEPLDRRRASLAAWGASRDAARESRRNPAAAFGQQGPPLRATAADLLRGTSADRMRGTNADQLRATPGEVLADARPGRLSEAFERPPATPIANLDPPLRALGRLFTAPRPEREDRRARRRQTDADGPSLREPGPGLGEAGRRLADAGRCLTNAGRCFDGLRPAARPASERRRSRDAGDSLDRRLTRARHTMDSAERALDQARDAIPGDWQERARERIPGLGRADTYVREAAKKLSMLVGTIEEIGEKADRMRNLARDMRELKEADEANDEVRRERALSRLKAKRKED